MHNLIYFNTKIESIQKRKHLLFLQKSNFNIVKVIDLKLLLSKVKDFNPVAIIVTDQENLLEMLPNTDLPIICLLKEDYFDILSKVKDFSNTIFFRNEADPIDTVEQTLKLIVNSNNLLSEKANNG